MKKLNLFFMAMAMLLMGAGFTACSDDDDNNGGAPDLGTPQYEGVSGKYSSRRPALHTRASSWEPAATTW